MKLVTYDDGKVGRIEGDEIVCLDVPTMREYFERGGADDTGERRPLVGARLRAPIVPKKFFHTAGNFREHEEESKTVSWSHEIAPWIVFFQNVDAIIGPDEPVVYPEHLTEELDYELELAVIIGKDGKWFGPDEAMDYVAGYVIFNDITARDIQRREMRSGVFSFCKAIDTFCPLGPWIVTADEIPDPHNLAMTLRVNGETRQTSHSSRMSTTIPEIVSHYAPLGYSAGDVLSGARRAGAGTGALVKRKAFITGITGQDGSYLAEILLEKGYEVYGMVRRSSSFNTARIDHIFGDVELVFGDLSDGSVLNQLMRTIRPGEVYNLGAQSHVRVSFDVPEYTADTDAMGTLRLLDAIREEGVQARFYQASSSEMFGKAREIPQTEETPFHPRSPYGVSKVFSYWITRNYREAYGMYAVNGILFNHESPRRGPTFVTRKITRAVGAILRGEQEDLKLGNLEAKRDWGYAKDYMDGAWRMLQLDEPDDFVLATGETHSVEEFLDEAFGHAGLEWRDYVKIDERYFRPAEVDVLIEELVRMMVDADRERGKLEEHYL